MRRGGKISDYGQQLRAKQRLKGYYGTLSEKQMKRLYREAKRLKGDTGKNLIGLLERRLASVVYRMKFVPTVFAARQLVNHGHVTVNGKKVDRPSYMVRPNDVIEVRQRSREIPMVLEAMSSEERDVPDYLQVDFDRLKGTFLHIPQSLEEIPYAVTMEPSLVIEYYSR